MGASRDVASNNSSECILDALKPANVFLCDVSTANNV